MQVESSRDLEMAGITYKVYDIFNPTPVSLKQLSAIAVSLEIWRCKVNKFRNDGKLKKFDPSGERISSKQMLPDLPTTLYPTIDKYVRRFGPSLEDWLNRHRDKIFYFYYDHRTTTTVGLLKYFDDFVCDYTGAIDYLRTAIRMMHCDRFNANQKFVIACTYFFEDDIRRIWPSVCESFDLNTLDFNKNAQLCYWICCFRNELDLIRSIATDGTLEEVMLTEFMPHNRPSVEYFWNGVPTEYQMRMAKSIFITDVPSFVLFVLPKLDRPLFDEFINEYIHELISRLFKNTVYNKEVTLSTWKYVQDALDEDDFTYFVRKMLEADIFYKEDDYLREWRKLCCEIWNVSPETLKRSAVEDITLETEISDIWYNYPGNNYSIPPDPKEFEFLSVFLSSATSKEKINFWFYYLPTLKEHVRCQDLSKIMKLCFKNDDDIIEFKNNLRAGEDSYFWCMHYSYMYEALFCELNEFANFLWPDVQAARKFKQEVLEWGFLRDDVEFEDGDFSSIIQKSKQFNELIDDAYGNADLSMDFKNQLTSSPAVQRSLAKTAMCITVGELAEFIETIVPNEEIVLQIKSRIIDHLKERGTDLRSDPSVGSLLSWCLGSEKEVEKFLSESDFS